jgi:hypothetical protein
MKKIGTTVAVVWALAAAGQDSTAHAKGDSVLLVSGHVEAYYSYDLNRPPDHRRPSFLYSHNRHQEATVNLAFVKGSYTTKRVRAALAGAAGTYMNANYAAEPATLRNLYEASTGYQLLARRELWLDIGLLPSHIGFESAHSPSCWTLTRSLAAENSPYYEAGARLSYTTPNDQWHFSALALNGWQRIRRVEGNSLVSWGTQVQFRNGEKLTLNYSTFLGTDDPDTARRWRFFHDLYAVWHPTTNTGIILGLDYGWQQRSKNSARKSAWYTPVGIFRFAFTDTWAAAVRGEYYSDEEGVLIQSSTPHGFKTLGVSLNVDYAPMQAVLLRLEGRTLRSREAVFTREARPVKTNTALTFSLAVSLERAGSP